MKKYLFGLFAATLAICLSAFTKTNSISTKSDPAFYYRVNPDDDFKVLEIYGSTTREEAESQSTCDDSGSVHCVRGYATDPELLIGEVSPDNPTYFIKKTN